MAGITYYVCRLTGAENGLSDVTLPISSFTVRHRDATESYYQVTIPSLDNVDAIAARPLGKVVIDSHTDTSVDELMRGPVGDVRVDSGPYSDSISISGNASRATSGPVNYVIETATYSHNAIGGTRRLRIAPVAAMRPGDTVEYDGSTWDVLSISWNASASGDGSVNLQMEIEIS